SAARSGGLRRGWARSVSSVMPSMVSTRRLKPSNTAPSSISSETWVMSATTRAVEASVTEVAVICPARLPAITATSTSTVPVMVPPSPSVSRCATTSPLIDPLMCRSPWLTTSPSIFRSLLRIDGAAGSRSERPPCSSSLFAGDCLNHILACLQKLFRILGHAVDQHLVVEMRACAAPRAAELADHLMHRHHPAARHKRFVEMAEAGDDAMAVVDLDDLAIGTFRPGKDHAARRGAVDRRAIGRDEVEAGMEGLTPRERIGAAAEGALEAVVGERRRQRQRLDDVLQLVGALRQRLGREQGLRIGIAERDIGPTLATRHRIEAAQQILDIDAGGGDELLDVAGVLAALIGRGRGRLVGGGTRR